MTPIDLTDPPLSVIESWPAPNYIDPPDRGPALFILAILLPIVGTLTIGLRTYSRLRITKSFGLDDALIWVSLAFTLALSALIAYANQVYYNGRHIYDIPLWTMVPHQRNNWLCQVCYIVALTTVKTSILLFYRRLTVRCSTKYMIAIRIGLVYNFLYAAAFLLVLLLTCKPTYAYWMQYDPNWVKTHHYSCISEAVSLPLSGIFSIVGDIYATALPLFVIRKMQMQSRQRMILYAIFSVGALVVLSGVIRTAFIFRLEYVSYDYTWDSLWELWIWSLIEIWLSIICASAPALKPFFRKSLFGSSSQPSRPLPPAYAVYANKNKNSIMIPANPNKIGGGKSSQLPKIPATVHDDDDDDDDLGRSDSKSILVSTEVSIVETNKGSDDDFFSSVDIESFYGYDRRGGTFGHGRRGEAVPLAYIRNP